MSKKEARRMKLHLHYLIGEYFLSGNKRGYLKHLKHSLVLHLLNRIDCCNDTEMNSRSDDTPCDVGQTNGEQRQVI